MSTPPLTEQELNDVAKMSDTSLTQQELDEVAKYEKGLDEEFERAYLNFPTDLEATIEEEAELQKRRTSLENEEEVQRAISPSLPESQEKGKGKATEPPESPPTTDPLHPGYPFHEKTDHDEDLPQINYEHPYLAAQTHGTNGDPRVIGTNGIGQPLYNEGALEAQPVNKVDDDVESEVPSYPFGENSYLDPAYLQALGTLEDQGLAAEGLRLVQLESEFCYLGWWETRLADRERAVAWE